MKILKATILLLLICSNLCQGQLKQNNIAHDKSGNQILYAATTLNANIPVLLTVDASTKAIAPFNQPPGQPLTNLIYLEGTKEINLTAKVYQDSLAYYRYNITVDDKEMLIANAIPTKNDLLSYPPSFDSGFVTVNLGTYNVQNKKLTLSIYKISESHQVNTVIIYNKQLKPATIFLIYLQKRLKNGRWGVEMNNLSSGVTINLADDLNGLMFSIKNTDVNFIYHVFLKNLASGKTIELSNNWIYDYIQGHPYILIDKSKFSDRGNYEIHVVPVLAGKSITEKTTVFRFTVQKEFSFSKKETALLLGGIIIFSGILIGLIKVNSNKRVAKEKEQKEITQLKLNLVRSQLNPHFMFNALAGIQNLMNKNDVDNANRYLGKFARLTRNVLNNQELISLEEEIELLEDYLQMEKLRFNFNYAILVDKALDKANIEIPTMLLQPFVENAVKHGVSGLLAKGEINVRLEKKEKDLFLYVKDNGSGFDTKLSHTGMGLNLSQKRIALLNNMYTDTPILFNVKSEANATEVKISLKNWL